MAISRRRFLKFSAGTAAALGINIFDNPLLRKAFASAIKETPVIWFASGACSGCSVSLLNTLSPRIQDVLLDQVVPGHHVNLAFHPTVMAAAGDQAMNAMYEAEEKSFILVVEGSVITADPRMCEVGESHGHGIEGATHIERLGKKAQAVIAVGSCAAFGGVPAGGSNSSGSMGVAEFFKKKGVATPVINLPGCAIHPDWFISTLATYLLAGPEAIEVDTHGRPKAIYSKLIHDNCPLRGHFDAGRFAEKFGDSGCVYKLGCKGPITHANCPEKPFNSGTNWCIGNNHPCNGCAEPGYPFDDSMWAKEPIHEATPPATYPPIYTDRKQDLDWTPGYTALAGLAAGAVGMKALGKGKDSTERDQDKKE